jgi:hypothetical protein
MGKKQRNPTRLDVQSVTRCPRCRAPKGEPCRGNGRKNHLERVAATYRIPGWRQKAQAARRERTQDFWRARHE